LVGSSEKAEKLVAQLQAQMSAVQQAAHQLPRKPIVYFEEWDEPMMCSIKWAAELIEIAGGQDCFPELSAFHSAADRTVTPAQVLARMPDIVIGSWCGKKFNADLVKARAGWENMPAVNNNRLFEIKSVDILQPGPSVITHGLKQLADIIQQWGSTQ
jgi:iron complex transport system substrate-binding protein